LFLGLALWTFFSNSFPPKKKTVFFFFWSNLFLWSSCFMRPLFFFRRLPHFLSFGSSFLFPLFFCRPDRRAGFLLFSGVLFFTLSFFLLFFCITWGSCEALKGMAVMSSVSWTRWFPLFFSVFFVGTDSPSSLHSDLYQSAHELTPLVSLGEGPLFFPHGDSSSSACPLRPLLALFMFPEPPNLSPPQPGSFLPPTAPALPFLHRAMLSRGLF